MMGRRPIRYCACGCRRIIDGRSDKRYLNNTHRMRAKAQPVIAGTLTHENACASNRIICALDPSLGLENDRVEGTLEELTAIVSEPLTALGIDGAIYRLCMLLRESADPSAVSLRHLLIDDLPVALGLEANA